MIKNILLVFCVALAFGGISQAFAATPDPMVPGASTEVKAEFHDGHCSDAQTEIKTEAESE